MTSRAKTWRTLRDLAAQESERVLAILDSFLQKRGAAQNLVQKLQDAQSDAAGIRVVGGQISPLVLTTGTAYAGRLSDALARQKNEVAAIDRQVMHWQQQLAQSRTKELAYARLLERGMAQEQAQQLKTEQKLMDELASRSAR